MWNRVGVRLTEMIMAETACNPAEALLWIDLCLDCLIEALAAWETVALDGVGWLRTRKFPVTATLARIRMRTHPRPSYAVTETFWETRWRFRGKLVYFVPGERVFAACQLRWLQRV